MTIEDYKNNDYWDVTTVQPEIAPIPDKPGWFNVRLDCLATYSKLEKDLKPGEHLIMIRSAPWTWECLAGREYIAVVRREEVEESPRPHRRRSSRRGRKTQPRYKTVDKIVRLELVCMN